MTGPFARYPSLAGRTVFVTGGASGIGAALVEAFHGQGARVAFIDRDAAAGRALADRLAGVRFEAVDVRDADALAASVQAAGAALGPIRVLVNNVADDTRHRALETDAAAWRERLAVNLDPTFLASTAAQSQMAEAGGGSIINLASINALLGPPDMPAYIAAKAAILGLTKALAREWGGQGIRVNAISPGWVVTERQLALWLTPQAEAEWARQTALPGRIQPEDVARLALFLAADDSAMITGQNHVIDAGRT
jgi:NAD(P)-dependent dehydrogenase (short-subunit alcohol dehydrogenase family)